MPTYKQSCDQCGSSDAVTIYEDGHSFCYSCRTRTMDNIISEIKTLKFLTPMNGYCELTKRKIELKTCEKYHYFRSLYKNEIVQVANYYDKNNQLVAQKVRNANKEFSIIGNGKDLTLFGQQLWNGGKVLVITEGEIDCLSVAQLRNLSYPVVSLPNGAAGAKKSIINNYDFILKFDQVILMFDQDEPGQKGAIECAEILPVGRAFIASLSLKDANEMLVANKGSEVIQAIYQAKEYRPDDILDFDSLYKDITESTKTFITVKYPWTELNTKTEGFRSGELVCICAGSGTGKSTFIKEIAYCLLTSQHKLGMIMLEESPYKTVDSLLTIHNQTKVVFSQDVKEEWSKKYKELFKEKNIFIYSHFGSNEIDTILARIRYLVSGVGCKWIFLDHISILISAQAGGDERKSIDHIMTKLRTLVEELHFGLFLVSHLSRLSLDKQGHEGGAEIRLSHLRGSHSIAQLSDMVIGLERNQQDDTYSNNLRVRILKNRFNGETGLACHLVYDKDKYRIVSDASRDFTKPFLGEGRDYFSISSKKLEPEPEDEIDF